MSVLTGRLVALREPAAKVDSYGRYECGCTWDSGPFPCYCHQHNAEDLFNAAVVALLDAIDASNTHAVDEAAAVLRALLNDPTAGVEP